MKANTKKLIEKQSLKNFKDTKIKYHKQESIKKIMIAQKFYQKGELFVKEK